SVVKTQSKAAPSRKINLNKASLADLTTLPGVGPATAEKIIEHRKTNGAFSSVDDLDDIKGIGEKKLEKIRPYATVR
ncbi:MAG TPA: helix-hairpin-helix domain-containing protein, partial [Abditibacteriaceae bacterium]